MIETYQIKNVIFLFVLSKKNNKFLFPINKSGTRLSLDFNVRIDLIQGFF